MAERPENSVLFSLRELKDIEESRVREEADAERSRADAEKQQRMDSDRRQRESEDARRRAAEDEERRRADDVERQRREESLRLEEAERRARVDAQMKLEEQRLRMEMEAKTAIAHKKPKALYAASAVLVLAVVALVFFVVRQGQEKNVLEAQQLAMQAEFDKITAQVQRNQQEVDDLLKRLDQEQDAAARQRIREELATKQAERDLNQVKLKDLQERGKQARVKSSGSGRKVDKPAGAEGPKCDPNDPLCGT